MNPQRRAVVPLVGDGDRRWLRRSVILTTLVATMLTALPAPAGAITEGELDGNRHPNVAMIVAYRPDGRFRCSATLVSPTVLVTAAHCTEGVLGNAIATFDPVAPPAPEAADDVGDGRSATGYMLTPAGWLGGTPHAHPLFDWERQLNDLHDVGVVVLDEPYIAAAPVPIAPAGYLDDMTAGRGLNNEIFDVVGYGGFFDKPADGPQKPTTVSDRIRRFTSSPGQMISSQMLKLAGNANDSRGGGGACFGDSGGPAMHAGYLVANTSYGPSPFCRSYGGFYRLDTTDARSFLDDFVTLP